MQQINLYTQELKPKQVVLPLSQMVAGLSVLLAILIIIFFFYRAELSELEAQVPAKKSSFEQLQRQVLTKEETLKGMQKDESLITLNHKLNQQVMARKELLSKLGSVVTANPYPFSDLLTGLARQRVDQLWLTRIRFDNGGRTVGLQGKTLQADAVPHYIQMLRGEPLLLGRSFDLFQLMTDDDQTKMLHFTLSSSFFSEGEAP
ncbi:PilN domain-containing protein [Alkalimarinus alittae]|uniref:PilN domain-containing protein n=1 Tax=Alkalimarinus alittae TaxID=2961619 RepID=A0ABY6N128_9ALTE|nr:PilN domain-containing protein [Alkalimarinus alittae]UZE95789.1 PilN domain-containing protein [Alkalimarinus alittae]